jgi:hypothetical protein
MFVVALPYQTSLFVIGAKAIKALYAKASHRFVMFLGSCQNSLCFMERKECGMSVFVFGKSSIHNRPCPQ